LSRLRLTGVHPEVRFWAEVALDVADRFDVPVSVTSGFRSLDDQARLRALWEAGLSRFPANRPGDSSHNFGLAFDSQVSPQHQALWDRIRQLVGFELLQNDEVHAQVPGWRRFR
jgi:hypothetical protein